MSEEPLDLFTDDRDASSNGHVELPPSDVAGFLEAMWGAGLHSVCWQGAVGGFQFTHVASPVDVLARIDSLQDVDAWIGAHPLRAVLAGKRGIREDVAEVVAIPGDLDWAHPTRRTSDPLPSEAEVRDGLRRLGLDLQPSAVIHSGHGLQTWWFLESAVSIEVAETLIAQLDAALESVGLVNGRPDLASILRLPGTRNHKGDDEPVPVVIEWMDRSRRFVPEYLAKHLPAATGGRAKGAGTKHRRGAVTDDQQALLDHIVEHHRAHSVDVWRDGSIHVVRPDKLAKDGTSASIIVGADGDAVLTVFSHHWPEIGPVPPASQRSYVLSADGTKLVHPHDIEAVITFNAPPKDKGDQPKEKPVTEPPKQEPGWRRLIVDGRSWLRSGSTTVETVWGDQTDALIPRLQPTLIVGESGAGKTTLAHLVMLGAIGVPGHEEMIGWPVRAMAEGERVLYLASDRPDQARIAMLRHFSGGSEATWQLVEDRLRVWRGPPPDSLARSPGLLLEMAEATGAGLVVTDSTKDMAVQLSDDKVGAAVNQAHQLVIASGRDLVALHHPRKRGREHANDRPTLDDVFGSAWLSSGAGSVLFLTEEPMSTEVLQLKTPNGRQANVRFRIDPVTGLLAKTTDDVLDAVVDAGPGGISTKHVTVWVSGVKDPTEAQIERTRRRLKVLEGSEAITTIGSGTSTRWVVS